MRSLSYAMFFLLLGIVLPALALAEIEVEVPEEVALGQPFLAEIRASGLSEVSVTWAGKTVSPPVSSPPDGEKPRAVTLLGSDVLRDSPGEYPLVLVARVGGEVRSWERSVRLEAKSYPEQRLKVSKAMAKPPQEVWPRIERERKRVGKALSTVSNDRLWELPFEKPVEGRTSSAYGLKRFFNDIPRNPHRGLDIAAAAGTRVRATSGGRVILVGNHYYAGKSVFVDHGLGVVSMYFHLSKILVRHGQIVSPGEVVGRVGMTGRVTGPHLHFGLSVLGKSVDPVPLFDDRLFRRTKP